MNTIKEENLMYRCDNCQSLCSREVLENVIVFRCYRSDCGNVWEYQRR